MANLTPRENGLIDQTINSFRKLHRIQSHVQFTTECSIHHIIPNFCKLGYRLIDNGKLTTNEINKIQNRNLGTALQENKEKLLVLQNDFEKHLTKLFFHCVSPTQFYNLVRNI
jgi:hypothetical protein